MKVQLDHELFNKAMPIMETLQAAGYPAYFVGGCVRDTLLGRPLQDVDIASGALPEEVEALFNNTIDLGKTHGTIIVVYKGTPYEVTTFRLESTYSDSRRPDRVEFVTQLEEDTLRRDFTINALALDMAGRVYDYHGGLEDLQAQRIRAVGNPVDRFNEDALRMVRAIRFAGQLGFDIDQATFEAILAMGSKLSLLSRERLRVEMTKFFQGAYFPMKGQLLIQTGLAAYMPGLSGHPVATALSHMQEDLEAYRPEHKPSERLVWALWTDYLAIPVQETKTFLKAWKHSNQLIEDVRIIRWLLPLFREKRLTMADCYGVDPDLLMELEAFFQTILGSLNVKVSELLNRLPIQSKKDIVIDGNDIKRLLALSKPGPEIGRVFNAIEQLIIQESLPNQRAAIEAYILQQR